MSPWSCVHSLRGYTRTLKDVVFDELACATRTATEKRTLLSGIGLRNVEGEYSKTRHVNYDDFFLKFSTLRAFNFNFSFMRIAFSYETGSQEGGGGRRLKVGATSSDSRCRCFLNVSIIILVRNSILRFAFGRGCVQFVAFLWLTRIYVIRRSLLYWRILNF